MALCSSRFSHPRTPSTTLAAATLFLLFGAGPSSVVAARSELPTGHWLISPLIPSIPSLQARLKVQNDIFAQQYRDDLRASPEGETAVGDYRDNARLDDYSFAASARQNAVDRAYRRAKQQLGAGFDIRTFHDELLSAGNLPLDILETRVNTWLAMQQNATR